MKCTYLSLAALSFVYGATCEIPIGAVVNTKDGPVQGAASHLRSEVSAYLGIPFAQPPVGSLRFQPPVAAQPYQSVLNATSFSPDCRSNLLPTNEAPLAGEAGAKILSDFAQAGDTFSEDCLTLNVWTKPQTGEEKKAVLFWIYGGGFSTGNTANPTYDGSILADENDVVVVSTNYRTNIFGFSGGPGLTQNVGLLDQRLALEWVRDNVAAFGGDPDRITVFGQSAGGASADYLSYAFPNDPIAHAFIPQSGLAGGDVVPGVNETVALQRWYNVSETLGCGGSEAGEATVDCVRAKDPGAILKAIEPFQVTAILSGFGPYVDNKTVFANYTALGEQGAFAKVPILVGNTDNEAPFFFATILAYTNITADQLAAASKLIELGQPVADLITISGFSCQTGISVTYRAEHGVPAFRYMYFGGTRLGDSGGGYNNTYVNYAGADYHISDLPIIFGTAPAVTGIPDSPVEAQAAAYHRRVWTEFAKDPAHGLEALGWVSGNSTVHRLGYADEAQASLAPPSDTDALCPILAQDADLATTIVGIVGLLATAPQASFASILQEQVTLIRDMFEADAPLDQTGSVNRTVASLDTFLSALGASA